MQVMEFHLSLGKQIKWIKVQYQNPLTVPYFRKIETNDSSPY